jgi:DNA polymerase III epsilon subunit family exonuclease
MQILEEFHTLVNPERHIPSGIERLTGITNEMVADAPTIDEVMSDVRNFLAESVIVGHNVSFDFRFLNWYHYKCFEEYLVNETICTMKLSRQYLPHLPNKKLSTVGEYFGIVNEQAHRAMSDTLATLQIFQKYLEWEKHSRSED